MAKAQVKKAKPQAKATAKPLAKAATAKPTAKAKVVAKTKPITAKVEKTKPATAKIVKPVARPKTERVERPSKIPVVNRADLNGLTSPFDRRQLKEWRNQLISKRHEITHDINGLVKDAMEAEDGHTTPNHIAERGSDADLQEFSLAMAGEEKVELWLIDRALRKIDDVKPLPFGLCEFTRQGIQKSRLELLPWTPLSIEGAQYMEENRLTLEDMLIDD